jgi:hypothetical protein
MSFPGDWQTNSNQLSTVIALDYTTPLVEDASLGIDATVGPERVTLQNNLYTRGLTAGAYQSIFRVTSLTTTSTERVGFVFMQNNPTISGMSDVGYGVFLNAGNNMSTPYVSIVKFTSGLSSTPTELTTSVSIPAPGLNDDFVLRAVWVASLPILGGTQIRAFYALGTDFDNLAEVADVIDTSSPITTTSDESLAFSFDGPGEFHVLIDETSIFELA